MTTGGPASKWLTVVGIGDDGLAGLGQPARSLIGQADILVGGSRHLDMIPQDGRQRLSWPKPFHTMNDRLAEFKGRRVCVLATGDPCCHGVGAVLARQFSAEELHIVPAPSAFSLACARLGWSLPQVDTLSAHGRPLARLHPFIQPNTKLLLLSENGSTPARVAQLLCKRGFGTSVITVLSHLGGEGESLARCQAKDWPCGEVAPALNTIAIECKASRDSEVLSRGPALPDETFDHDGQLTKREVRAVTLSSLAPGPGQHLWDVGAGCGSISIEWMRHDLRCQASALESNAERIAMIARNATNLGTPELHIVHGEAPQALRDLTPPDAIFVGGGVSRTGVLEACWKRLKTGGRLVANVVSLEGEAVLSEWHSAKGGALTRLTVERAHAIGKFRSWRPARPVTQLVLRKGLGR